MDLLSRSGCYDVDKVNAQIEKRVNNYDNYVFINIPGVNSPVWSDKIKDLFKKNISVRSDPEQDWLCITLSGTTLSGDGIRTTLGNTLDTICMNWFYIEESGIRDPWLRKDIIPKASGDDNMTATPKNIF